MRKKGVALDSEMVLYRTEQAESYLKQVRKLYMQVRELEAMIAAQRELVSGLKGIDYTKSMTKSSANNDKVPDGVSRLFEMISEATTKIAECVELQGEAANTLDEMGGLGGKVLKLRYVFARSWDDAAKTLGYSSGYLKRVAKDALCEYYDYMPLPYRDPKYSAI